MESIGFKEWSLVCDALGRGEQSLILRKGGIAEGRDGFSFRHREFFLFPTFFHEQLGKVRGVPMALPTKIDEIVVSLYAVVEKTARIVSLEMARALAPLHVLSPEVVQERFGYKDEGLNLAFVRVFRLQSAWILADEKRFGGCRSWVELPAPPPSAMEPVLDDATHAKRRADFDSVMRWATCLLSPQTLSPKSATRWSCVPRLNPPPRIILPARDPYVPLPG